MTKEPNTYHLLKKGKKNIKKINGKISEKWSLYVLTGNSKSL